MKTGKRKLHCLLFGVVLFSFPAAAAVFPQNTADDIKVRLSPAGGKTVYRMGEPIRLVLSFTAERGDYTVDKAVSTLASSYDEIILSPPASGIFEWAKEYRNEDSFLPNPLLSKLSPAATADVELSLNSFVRFDKPGKYSLKLKTRRVSAGDFVKRTWSQFSLVTNEVAFEIKEMSEAEEREEVRRLSAALLLLDAKAGGSPEENRITEELSYLSGEASTREKVRLFLGSQKRSENILLGLFIARDRALVIKLLEAALREKGREISHKLIEAAAKLRTLEEFANLKSRTGADAKELARRKIQRFLEIRQAYLQEINK